MIDHAVISAAPWRLATQMQVPIRSEGRANPIAKHTDLDPLAYPKNLCEIYAVKTADKSTARRALSGLRGGENVGIVATSNRDRAGSRRHRFGDRLHTTTGKNGMVRRESNS